MTEVFPEGLSVAYCDEEISMFQDRAERLAQVLEVMRQAQVTPAAVRLVEAEHSQAVAAAAEWSQRRASLL